MVSKQLLYYPTVTREPFKHQGRIPELLENGTIAKDLGIPLLSPLEDRIMICGSPEMLRDLKALAERKDFEEGSTSRPGDFVIERAFAGS
jgi:ferredoxin--NADP+ reductase